MSKYYCYLCASDEGILLDIFGDSGKTFRENIETCLSVKIKRSDVPSTKICHKCVYELDCCSKFLHKYEASGDSRDVRAKAKRGCCLCGTTESKVRILELKQGKSLNILLRKILEVFKGNVFKDKLENFTICLECRYNIDVLFDLKSIYRTTFDKLKKINEDHLELSDLPKTKTSVVSRKTTDIPVPGVNTFEDRDSDTSTSSMMSVKRKRGRPRKFSASGTTTPQFRCCEECKTCVEYGIDMYRYHRTGLTVCKECWLTMDPEKMKNGKRKKLANAETEGNTKLCAVFVKDVLSNPSKNTRAYKVEKDQHGNTTYLITDESSESEEKGKTPQKRVRGRVKSTTSIETTTTTTETKKSTKRLAGVKKNDKEDVPSKKVRTSARSSNEESTIVESKTKNGILSDSCVVMTTRTRRSIGETVNKVNVTVTAESRVETRKKMGKRPIGRPRKSESSKALSADDKSSSVNSSSNEDKVGRTMRTRKPAKSTSDIVNLDITERRSARRTRSNSYTSQPDAFSPTSHRSTPSRDSPAESRIWDTKIKRSKTKSPSAKNAKSDSELEKPYTCSVCRVGYKNKLIGKAHELTHEKQPEVKLKRVVIPEIIVEEAPTHVSLAEEPEEQSHDVSSTSDHKSVNSDNIEPTVVDSANVTTKNNDEKTYVAEQEKSSLTQQLKIDEKINNETKQDNDEKEADAVEITTDVPIVMDTETCEIKAKIVKNDNKENNEYENKENDENENKENDENENKENNENENKENNENENKENDESERKENDESEIKDIDESENKENDEIDMNNVENDEKNVECDMKNVKSDEKNESSSRIFVVDESAESSSLTESCEKKDDEVRETIVETEKPDSTPSENERKTLPEVSHEETMESSIDEKPINIIDTEDISKVDETENVEKEIEDKTETNVDKTVAENSEKIVEPSVDSSLTEATEPSEETKEIAKNDNEEKQADEREETNEVTEEKEDKEESSEAEKKENRSSEMQNVEKTEISESLSVANSVLREVFDLASAEVKKRLEKEQPNEGENKRATPVDETLENISREINSTSDISGVDEKNIDKSS